MDACDANSDILWRVVEREEHEFMGLLRGVVDSVIENMSPEERVDAIREVAEQAMDMMTPEERMMLAQMMLAKLIDPMSNAEREQLVAHLAPVPALVGGD